MKGNTLIDKWIQQFYHSKKNSPYRIKLGANCSSMSESCIYPDKSIELFYSDKFWKYYTQLYESVKRVEDINFVQLMEEIYLFKNEPIRCLVHFDKSLIKIAREETLAQFNLKKPETVFPVSGIKKDNVVDLWQVSLKFLYTDVYIKNIVKFLRKNSIKTILDCACGVGFPAIELKKAKFDITCSDASKPMLEKFRENCKENKVIIPSQLLDWRELSKLKKKFDCVICRGNSLIYVDTWERYFNHENILSEIKNSLKNMFDALNSKGILYVDMTSQAEYDAGPVIRETFGEQIIDNHRMELTWNVTHDWITKRRVVQSLRKVDGQAYEYNYYSFLLKHSELIVLMKEVGFKKVEKTKIEGENGYTIYIGYK